MFPTGEKFTVLFYLIITTSFGLCDQDAPIETSSADVQIAKSASVKKAPKDYVFSVNGTRVQNLVKFFEAKDSQDYYDPETKKAQNSLITLSEALMKLHILSFGHTIEYKCGRYVKLIEQPNIRTFAQVRVLMEENSLFPDVMQPGANLLERLTNERNFDALAKIQTLIQSLESEKGNLRSSLKLTVQKDMLDCVNYYIYRHQRATFGLVDFVRETYDQIKLNSDMIEASDVSLSKMNQLMADIENIEKSEAENCMKTIESSEMSGNCTIMKSAHDVNYEAAEWMTGVGKLYDLVEANHFEIPKLVRDFIGKPKRLKRLNKYRESSAQLYLLKDLALMMENNEPIVHLRSNNEYQQVLCDLHELVQSTMEIVADEMLSFVQEPNRMKLISSNCRSLESGMSDGVEVETKEKIDLDLGRDLSSDESNVKATNDVAETFNNTQPVSCRELSYGFQNKLRTFNEESLDFHSARGLAEEIREFLASCSEMCSNGHSHWRTRWTILSLTHKLSRWSLPKLAADLSLSDSDKAALGSVLKSTNKVTAKGIGSLYLCE